jgi:hypothetical protein
MILLGFSEIDGLVGQSVMVMPGEVAQGRGGG